MRKSIKRSLVLIALLWMASAGGVVFYLFSGPAPFKQFFATAPDGDDSSVQAPLSDFYPAVQYVAATEAEPQTAKPKVDVAPSQPDSASGSIPSQHETDLPLQGHRAGQSPEQDVQSDQAFEDLNFFAFGSEYRGSYLASIGPGGASGGDAGGGSGGEGGGSSSPSTLSGSSGRSESNPQIASSSEPSIDGDQGASFTDDSYRGDSHRDDSTGDNSTGDDSHHDAVDIDGDAADGGSDPESYAQPTAPTHEVPEPSVLFLFATGLMSLRWTQRLRRKD